MPEKMTPAGVFRWQQPVEGGITAFRPAGNPPAWDRVAGAVRVIVRQAGPRDPGQARKLMGVLAKLAIFADDEGYPPDAAALLTPELIERFVQRGCRHLAPATQRAYGRTLNGLREIVGADGRGRAGQPLLSDDLTHRPYSDAEMTALWTWAGGQPTERLRRGLKVLLTLGRGCGAESSDILAVEPGHVLRSSDGHGPVNVRLGTAAARLVVCRCRWEDPLHEQARHLTGQAGPLFQPNRRKNRSTSTITTFLADAHPAPQTPRLQLTRLRATWIVELLTERVPLPVIIAAAGPNAHTTLARVDRYLRNVDEAEATRLLRGEPRGLVPQPTVPGDDPVAQPPQSALFR